MSRTSSLAAALAALAPLAAMAQTPEHAAPRSAPLQNVRYEGAFDHAAAAARTLHVTTTFDVAGDGPVLLSLPAWTPGAYEIGNFARWVIDFEATGAGDKALTWDKLDFDTWRIQPAGARTITVRYDYVADSLDNAMSWSAPDFALFNGTNVFMYAEGRPLEFPATVTVRVDRGWRVATGMQSAGGTADAPRYSATNYHDLVDMPFFVGRFDIDSAQIVGRWVRFASYPAGSVGGAARSEVWKELKQLIPPEAAVFDTVPWSNYTVMQIADSSYSGASGLEHQSSHVDVITPLAIGGDFMPSLYAHEIFHSWNVKRLRPADMWPYVYDRPEPTPWLWVSEGITDYYADLAEVRGGVVEDTGFYRLTAAKMSEVASTPPVSLEDASLDTWIHPVDGTAYTYYPKGSLAGFILDIMIRDASNNAHSLDDVMRDLYRRDYEQGKGFTADDWWSTVSRMAGGQSFAQWAERYVNGREPFPWDSILPLAGLRAVRERVPRLGVSTQPDETGIRVIDVGVGSAAAEAGIRVGDYLVSVGDIEVTDPQFGERFRARYGSAPEGSLLPMTILRGGQRQTVQAKLRYAPGDYRVEAMPDASPKAARIRAGILAGKTG